MYESPLTKIYGDIQSQIIKQDEENMMFAVNRTVGYDVDKQELIKALNYDRNQYHIGFEDARKMYERPKGEWEQTRYRSIDQTGESYDDGIGFRCSNCANVFKVTSLARYNFCPNCGARMKGSE